MKFGKDFKNHLEETLPEWRDKFLRYKPLKKLIKHHHHHHHNDGLLPPEETQTTETPPDHHQHHHDNDNNNNNNNNNIDDDPSSSSATATAMASLIRHHHPPPRMDLEDWFVTILNEELEKFNDFYSDKEEDFVIRLQELKERIERARVSKNEDLTSEREFSEKMLEIRKAFVTIHGEMVLLKNYSSLNFAGLVKILKKYDKRTGGLLSLSFTQHALHQPFFTTEPLTRLVRECEANLELLFPLEAEVMESSTPATRDGHADKRNIETSSAKEDTDDVYRSTLAAMKAIQSLRKASSTYNPLSLAQFFHGQDDDDDDDDDDDAPGVVTDENSGS